MLVSVYTDVLEERGVHLLSVYLTSLFPKFVSPSPQEYRGAVPFRVEIWESGFVKPKNYAPLFEPAFKTSDSKIFGEDWEYALPSVVDPEFETEGYIPEEGEVWPYSDYLTAEAGGCCSFTGSGFTSGPDAAVGLYENTVTLCDSLENCETFKMSFEVKPVPVEPVIEEPEVI